MGEVATFSRAPLQQSYQASIRMAPFEALYGQKYRTLWNWIEPRERRYFGIDFVTEAEE